MVSSSRQVANLVFRWHQDITPSNILVISGRDLSASDATFKIADFGLSQFRSVPESPEEIRVWDASGTRIYGKLELRVFEHHLIHRARIGAPECWAADIAVDRQGVTQAVDIWSLGCVYSELAVWSAYGYPRLLQFRHERAREVKQSLGSGKLPCFHDGENLLLSVKSIHEGIIQQPKHSTLKPVIYWINSMLQAAPERRLPTANALRQWEDIRDKDEDVMRSIKSTSRSRNLDVNHDTTLAVAQQANTCSSNLSAAAEEGIHELASALERGELEAAANEMHNWLWETCPSYKLALRDLQLHLGELFKAVIAVQRASDQKYRFMIPRRLTDVCYIQPKTYLFKFFLD